MAGRFLLSVATLLTASSVSGNGLHAQSSFSIEDVMSYSFPTDLVAAPEGERIAWIANQEGLRNVWLAEGPDWTPRALTSYGADDGQELASLAFTPDGEHLIYLRGGGSNQDGELPNPTSEPDGVSRDLWMISTAGGEPVRVTGAVSPTMSPTANQIVWAAGGVAWTLDLDETGRGEVEPEMLFRVRAGLSDLQWSPDGDRIAFVSNRDGRAILGVFDLEESKLAWLTNTVDRDDLPRWSSDGRQIAFIRFPAGHAGFAVMNLDLRSGEVKELFRSPDDRTGRYPRTVSGSYDLMYGDGHLVFPGEWGGWNHLYSIPEDGGEVRELTPGDGIVENATLSSDGRSVWVSTNTQSIDHRQLGMAQISTGRTSWYESGNVIAWNPVPFEDDDMVAYLRSDAWEPASVYVRGILDDHPTRVTRIPDRFPTMRLIEPEQIIFEAEDGWKIHGQLFMPPGAGPEDPMPAVLFMHGGSRRQMFLGWHNRGYYHGAYAFNQYLASRGYAVFSVNYRSGIGYGVEFREPPNYGRRGASEYQDIVAAGRYLQTRDDVDPDRIGLWGGSYGGYLTALGLARNSDLFKAGVDLHGVHDWVRELQWYGRRPEVRFSEEDEKLAFESSPVADIDTWTSPVLIIHGDDDRNVPFQASIDLVTRLRRKGDVHFEELYFIDEIHGFLRHESWVTVFNAAADFFDRQLKNRR